MSIADGLDISTHTLTDDKLRELLDKIMVLDRLYDAIRLVDPVNRRVIQLVGNKFAETDVQCFSFWSKGAACENCISMRAYQKDETFVKIEHMPNKVYMVTAIPVVLEERRVVVELLKDMTNSIFIGDEQFEKTAEVYSLIEDVNLKVITDGLTNLFNRRYIDERLPAELVTASIQGYPVSVILADIDFFKKVNDVYGHLAGDMVLHEFGKILKTSIREQQDWAARFGGEEFLICLPNADKATAGKIAERMRKTVEAAEFTYNGNTFKITSSFGVNTVQGSTGLTFEEVIDVADKRLYEAKQSGRNMVV